MRIFMDYIRTKKILSFLFCAALIFSLFGGFTKIDEKKPVVEANGRLQVIGTQLCNRDKEPIQLKGMSLYDVSFYDQYCNAKSFKWLRDDWGVTVIRAAMYTEYGGAYNLNPGAMKKAVQAAIDAGIYVIVDWHILTDGNPQKHKKDALAFFKDMASTYKDSPNVIYEICNEPNGDITWKNDVKPYAEGVIPVIRNESPDSVILVGNPHWDSDFNIAADDPLSFKNIMYTCHFYQGNDGSAQRAKIDYAISKNAPIFVSEWDSSDSSATGVLYPTDTYTWINYLNNKKISWINWELSPILESSVALKPNASVDGSWSDGDLTESGLIVKYLIKNTKTAPIFADNFDSKNFAGGRWSNKQARITSLIKKSGLYSTILKKDSYLSKELATTSYSKLKLSLDLRTKDTKNNDTIKIEWFNGTQWNKIDEIKPSDTWKDFNYKLPTGAEGLKGFKFKISTNFHNDIASAYVDNVILTADR
jgi:aryl-phospho-beta-D-glucosidase BglC (GH1 family)